MSDRFFFEFWSYAKSCEICNEGEHTWYDGGGRLEPFQFLFPSFGTSEDILAITNRERFRSSSTKRRRWVFCARNDKTQGLKMLSLINIAT